VIILGFTKSGCDNIKPKNNDFLANSNEDGRDSSSSNFDMQLYHEYYGASFRRAFLEGGANA
jgi:hypothetical protein